MSVEELAKHKHAPAAITSNNQTIVGGSTANGTVANKAYIKFNTGTEAAILFATGETGESKPFSIMPPYYAVYVWKRIA
jgi:hypothetical protein